MHGEDDQVVPFADAGPLSAGNGGAGLTDGAASGSCNGNVAYHRAYTQLDTPVEYRSRVRGGEEDASQTPG